MEKYTSMQREERRLNIALDGEGRPVRLTNDLHIITQPAITVTRDGSVTEDLFDIFS